MVGVAYIGIRVEKKVEMTEAVKIRLEAGKCETRFKNQANVKVYSCSIIKFLGWNYFMHTHDYNNK